MSNRGKSRTIGLTLITIFLLVKTCGAQEYPITYVSGFGYKRTTKTAGVIKLDIDVVSVVTTFERCTYPVLKKVRIKNQDYYEVDSYPSAKIFIWVNSFEYNEKGFDFQKGVITIYKRYQNKPEEIIRYQFLIKL